MSAKKLIRKVGASVKRLFWVLAPAGGFVNPFKVLLVYLGYSRHELQSKISDYYPKQELFFLNSAKSALYILFNNLKVVSGRNILALPAYTCPDIASSALRAKLKLYLLDIEDTSSFNIQIPKESDSGKFCGVVGTNLYGLDDSAKLREYCLQTESIFVDDQCQSALSGMNLDNANISVMSFGRGKAFCAAGGGMLSISSEKNNESLISEINYNLREVPHAHTIEEMSYYFKLVIYWFFERPYLYWILAYLPFTKLGETRVDLDFPVRKASKMELAAMLVALREREKDVGKRIEIIRKYKSNLLVSSIKNYPGPQALLRFPVLCSEKMRASLEIHTKAFLKKYGISLSYPKTLDEYPELSSEVVNTGFMNAKSVSKRILTLPTHRYVRNVDVEKIVNFLNKFKG